MLFVFCFFINLVHCAGVVIAIPLKEIDNSPYAKPCSKCDYQCLQYSDCRIEKCDN